MAQIIDVRGSGGDLVIVGGALTLPTSANSVATVIAGSIRYNTTIAELELYNGTTWIQATGSDSGVTSWNGRSGGVSLTSTDIVNALGYVPLGSTQGLTFGGLPSSLALLPFVYTAPGLQTVNQQVWTIPVVIPFMLPLNCAGSSAIAGIAANAPAAFSLAYLRGTVLTTIGTINYAAGSTIGIFATLAYTALIGDVLIMTSPLGRDASLANIGIVIVGVRSV